MSFRTLMQSAASRVREAVGFAVAREAAWKAGFAAASEAIRSNQQALAQAIALAPRPLARFEAQALMLLASHGGRYRQQARAALWLAAQAAGRQDGPLPTMEPRLNKASTARLAYWATDRGTPV